MADLKAEQIMAAVLTLVNGLATTGANVERDRVYPSDKDASLSIEMGGDEPVSDQTVGFIDSLLDISIVAFVKQNDTYSTVINQVRKEVHIAMMATEDLGLSFVHDVMPSGTEKPEAVSGSNKPVMRMPINFQVLYRHSITDASV